MRSVRVLIWILPVLLLVIGCDKTDDKPSVEENQVELRASLVQGSWHITSYSDDGIDHTAWFNGFLFTFNENGTLGATDGQTALSGAWSLSGPGDDDSEPYLELTVYFAAPDAFREISEDWKVVGFKAAELTLSDSGTDTLVLQK